MQLHVLIGNYFSSNISLFCKKNKNFVCKCKRCLDPKEFGSCLSGLKCRDCNNNNGSVLEKDPNVGVLLPIDPTNTNSDLICDICKSIMPSERVKYLSTLHVCSNRVNYN